MSTNYSGLVIWIFSYYWHCQKNYELRDLFLLFLMIFISLSISCSRIMLISLPRLTSAFIVLNLFYLSLKHDDSYQTNISTTPKTSNFKRYLGAHLGAWARRGEARLEHLIIGPGEACEAGSTRAHTWAQAWTTQMSTRSKTSLNSTYLT